MTSRKDSQQTLHGDPLYERVIRARQGHIFNDWDTLTEEGKQRLIDQVNRVDFDLLESAFQIAEAKQDFAHISPVESVLLDGDQRSKTIKIGEQALRDHKVALLVLAGGQGTRLGYPFPKGMYPIGPISGKSLFEWFAEKVQFFNRQYQAHIPWLIMTSPATDAQTRLYFQKNDYFHQGKENIDIFQQGMLPAFDFEGRLLMDAHDHICESPDGHGGVVRALKTSGLLEKLDQLGIQHIFIHNVDNCLTKILDPTFVGYHIEQTADLSMKCLTKLSAGETLGAVVKANDQIKVIEYSDIPKNIANLRDSTGQLVYKTGSINTYVIRIDFIKRLYRDNCVLPYHRIPKKIRAIDSRGILQDPNTPNGIKLETKLFDVLQYTTRAGVLMANRGEDFSPLKSDQGQESYESVARDLYVLFSGWFEDAGIQLEIEKVTKIEISPLFAVDRDSFKEKVAAVGQRKIQNLVKQQINENGWIRL